jgi:phosphinothricin acetyltransferase
MAEPIIIRSASEADAPAQGSVALHGSVGFESIGIFKAVGRKFGKWHDIAWFQRALRDSPPSE